MGRFAHSLSHGDRRRTVHDDNRPYGPGVERLPIASSAFAGVWYDWSNHVLEVLFKNGTRYRYFMVPSSIVAALTEAESPGQFFVARIRGRFGEMRAH